MGRKIRLTESEFHSFIRRIVIETKETMDDDDSDYDDMGDESDYSKMSKEMAVKKISTYLKRRLSKNQEEKLKDQLDESRRYGRYLYEDEDKDLSSRKSGSLGKSIKRGGLALSATGAVAALGSIMGYSEGKLTSLIHDITANAGLGEYTGPVTYAMIAAGLAMALYGRKMEYEKTGK